MKERKKRIVNTSSKEENTIYSNIKNTSYSEEDKARLKVATERLNALLEEEQVSQVELASILNISSGAMSKYTTGSGFINVEFLPRFAKFFDVSTDYLLGISEVKKHSNNELNKRFGLNDNAIDMLDVSFPKESINAIFDNDRESINYLFETIKDYKDEIKKFKKLTDNKANDLDIGFAKHNVTIAKYCMQDAFLDLINENINR